MPIALGHLLSELTLKLVLQLQYQLLRAPAAEVFSVYKEFMLMEVENHPGVT